jgi:hypothetical protein
LVHAAKIGMTVRSAAAFARLERFMVSSPPLLPEE